VTQLPRETQLTGTINNLNPRQKARLSRAAIVISFGRKQQEKKALMGCPFTFRFHVVLSFNRKVGESERVE
jgi:hypothetical protein